MSFINKDFVYQEPEERKQRREKIRKAQLPVEKLENLVKLQANEREMQKILQNDLSFLADAFALPAEEYICLSEYGIGQLGNHIKYIKDYTFEFHDQIHQTREEVMNNKYSGRALLGPVGELFVDEKKLLNCEKLSSVEEKEMNMRTVENGSKMKKKYIRILKYIHGNRL